MNHSKFAVISFENRNGVTSWRVDGRLHGVRIRKNFKTREEAAAEKAVLEIKALANERWLAPDRDRHNRGTGPRSRSAVSTDARESTFALVLRRFRLGALPRTRAPEITHRRSRITSPRRSTSSTSSTFVIPSSNASHGTFSGWRSISKARLSRKSPCRDS